MDEQQALATYEHIARLTQNMLAATRASQWDQLTALERQCGALVALLVEHDRRPPASPQYLQRKSDLIRGILADDAQIRLLVEPQLKNLSALLASTRQQQRLARAYESDR